MFCDAALNFINMHVCGAKKEFDIFSSPYILSIYPIRIPSFLLEMVTIRKGLKRKSFRHIILQSSNGFAFPQFFPNLLHYKKKKIFITCISVILNPSPAVYVRIESYSCSPMNGNRTNLN